MIMNNMNNNQPQFNNEEYLEYLQKHNRKNYDNNNNGRKKI